MLSQILLFGNVIEHCLFQGGSFVHACSYGVTPYVRTCFITLQALIVIGVTDFSSSSDQLDPPCAGNHDFQ